MSITQPHIEGAKLILWTPIDDRHRATGGCRHYHDGQIAGVASWMAICRFDEGEACYLFRYHPDSNRYSDTFHESVEEAKHQAEFEYEGVSKTWVDAA
ncbi:MAG: hypothetical protein ABSD29_11280 [Verrucomicrobiota bacterium]|jgi:hypothetical protein